MFQNAIDKEAKGIEDILYEVDHTNGIEKTQSYWLQVLKCYSGKVEEREVEITELRQTGKHYRK